MDGIRAFFSVNRDLILFAYGQVFFVLGLAIALQSRRYSQLGLARSLSWLAAFGFAHGLYEWGDLFIPIQAAYLAPEIVVLLNIAQLLLLGFSFACLMQFGLALLRPVGRWRWLHGLAMGVLAVWLLAIFVFTLPFSPDLLTWHHNANALARYGIGFPGGLLAALGLRQEALGRIAPLQVPHIVRMLRLAGLSLAAYAGVGGLIPPPVAFFPGNLLNELTFSQALGFPALVLRSGIGLLLALTVIRALEVFDVETERRIEAMEQQRIVAAERERLARELHDGTIQNVYSVGLMVDSAQRLTQAGGPVAERLASARTVLDDTIGALRRSLGVLRGAESGATAEPLGVALERLTRDPRLGALADVSLTLELLSGEGLSSERTAHVLAMTGEALANAIRHGHATRVGVKARRADGRLRLEIRDDGVGGAGETSSGHGLRNLRERARLLGGELRLSSPAGKGTTVRLDIPWDEGEQETPS